MFKFGNFRSSHNINKAYTKIFILEIFDNLAHVGHIVKMIYYYRTLGICLTVQSIMIFVSFCMRVIYCIRNIAPDL